MLTVIDQGCSEHQSCEVILNGAEAVILKDILRNLPREGECRTYICEHGHTHHLRFHRGQESAKLH